MKPDQSLQDLIQEQLAVVELPTAARDRLINELFNEISKDGINGWAYLANCLFHAIARHHGDAAARRIFSGSGRPPKRLLTALRNATVLMRLDAMKPKPNIAQLARELAKENKTLPRQQQRGAGGTDVQVLESHIHDLVAARKEHCARRT